MLVQAMPPSIDEGDYWIRVLEPFALIGKISAWNSSENMQIRCGVIYSD
jgi:hypothetical protein